jgi:quinoprotein relay system zinc metallohydrolase 1
MMRALPILEDPPEKKPPSPRERGEGWGEGLHPSSRYRTFARRLFTALLACTSALAHAQGYDYALKPQQVAPDVYVFEGRTEDFTLKNGGNIVNTGFIVGAQGVIVIDSGPSKRYGEQMRAAIWRVTKLPIAQVFNTHHHPDHFFGNQAFADAPIAALGETIESMQRDGAAFADNLYRMSGAWMSETTSQPASAKVQPGKVTVAGRKLRLIALAGHSAGDLAILDIASGVLFAGDLVFFQRAPTTPHADLARWHASLDQLEALQPRALVPGHGPVVHDARAIAQTRAYLRWLERTLRDAAGVGRDMAQLMEMELPAEFAALGVARTEFQRSVTHFYPGFEAATLEAQAR